MRLYRVGLLIGFLATVPGSPAWACSCAHPSAENLLRDAAAIFTGVAASSRPAQPGFSITTFRVTEGFKGANAGATIRVTHRSGSSASCGVRFASGETHTLSAYARNGALSTSLCSSWVFRSTSGPDLIARLRELRGR